MRDMIYMSALLEENRIISIQLSNKTYPTSIKYFYENEIYLV